MENNKRYLKFYFPSSLGGEIITIKIRKIDISISRIKNKLKEKGITLLDVVDINEIRDFENKYNVTLPEEMVLFYTMISNGCEMIDGFQLRAFEDWKYDDELISKEFPFEKYYILEEDDNFEINHIEYGNIELIDIGDAQTWNVIINGKEQGNMWFFTDVGIQPAAPRLNFLEWFEFWLDGGEDYFKEFVM